MQTRGGEKLTLALSQFVPVQKSIWYVGGLLTMQEMQSRQLGLQQQHDREVWRRKTKSSTDCSSSREPVRRRWCTKTRVSQQTQLLLHL